MKAIVGSISQGLRQVRLLIEVIAGAVQPGLAKLVRRIVARHLRNNSEYCAHRYPRFVRLARWLVGHPVYALAIVAAPYAAAILLARFGYLHRFDFADTQYFLTINIGTLTAQAALVGLVFPLVIAFVGLLNRGQASFSSRLTIYIESSSAIFVGVSSLLLCAVIVAQLPLAAKMDGESATFTLLNLVWFAINVRALVHFVLRTIAFLHPVRRAPIMRAYVANVIWPRELTGTVTANRWGNVNSYGYLPAGDDTDPFGHGTQVRVWYTALWDGGEPRVSRALGKRVRLVDVRVAMLAPVVREWLARARLADDGRTHDFVIPLELGHDYQGEQTLVSATLPLGPVARLAIRASLRFRKAPTEDGSINQTSAILREMIADLIALIDRRQADEFKDQLRDVIDFHAFLYRLAQNSDEDLSYAQFGDGWGSTLSDDWTRAYRDVIRRAVERVPEETEFVSRLAYAPALVYGRVASGVTPKALQSILTMAEGLAYRLIDWALGEYRAVAMGNIGSRRAFTLSRYADPYARAWREFVAGWERLLFAIATMPGRRERRDQSWDEFKRIAENVGAHLRATTQMVAHAAWLGDTLATNWASDLMLHWQIQAERAWGSRSAYWQVRSEALTPEILERDWAEVGKLPLTQGDYPLTEAVVFGATIRNTWRDHVIILASLCVHWAIRAGAAETAKQAARRLLNGEPYDRGDAGVNRDRGLSGTKILISVLRITGSGERFAEHSYRGRIDHLLEGLGQIGESPYVPMRIYTSSGGLSFEDLPRALAISMMATISDSEAINGDLRRLLTQSDDEALRRREHYLQALLTAFDELDADKDGNVFSELERLPS